VSWGLALEAQLPGGVEDGGVRLAGQGVEVAGADLGGEAREGGREGGHGRDARAGGTGERFGGLGRIEALAGSVRRPGKDGKVRCALAARMAQEELDRQQALPFRRGEIGPAVELGSRGAAAAERGAQPLESLALGQRREDRRLGRQWPSRRFW
jgi:hypothetical protein